MNIASVPEAGKIQGVKPIPFDRVKGEINDNISKLTEKLETLRSRLDPVLKPVIPEKEVGPAILKEENSQVITWMKFMNGSIKDYISGIEDIISRLEI